MASYWKRALATTSIAAIAALGLTACGDDGSSNASSKSSENSSSSSSEEPKAAAPLTAEDFVERTSAAQNEAKTVHTEMVTTANGTEVSLSGDLELNDDPSKIKMSMVMPSPAGGDDIEMRMIDGAVYLNMGEMSQGKFVRGDASEAGAADFAELMEQSDPKKQMEAFAAGLEEFEVADETETIDGVETRKYTLTVNSQKMLEAQGGEAAISGTELPETVTYDMYIGDDDLPRRISMDVSGSAVEMNFTGWGEKIEIEVPSDDQIIEESELGY